MKIEDVELKENIWEEFKTEHIDDKRIKIETGKEYNIGVKSVSVKKIHYDNNDGTTKVLPALVLHIDMLNNEQVDREIWVTSKKLLNVIKVFHLNGDLFKKIFKLIKMGEGFQTNYVFVPIAEKKGGEKK